MHAMIWKVTTKREGNHQQENVSLTKKSNKYGKHNIGPKDGKREQGMDESSDKQNNRESEDKANVNMPVTPGL